MRWSGSVDAATCVTQGYHADVALPALNRGVQALIFTQVRPLHRQVIDSFQDFAHVLPEVLSVFVLAGNDDFLLHVAVQDLDRLHAFLIDRLSKRKEVAGFRTSVLYRHTRATTISALDPSTEAPAGTHDYVACRRITILPVGRDGADLLGDGCAGRSATRSQRDLAEFGARAKPASRFCTFCTPTTRSSSSASWEGVPGAAV